MTTAIHLSETVRESISLYNDGGLTFDELRTYLLLNLNSEEEQFLFNELPPSIAAPLIKWLTKHRGHFKRGESSVVVKSPSEVDADAITKKFLASGRRVSSRLSNQTSWLAALNLNLAAANTRTDTLGDWYRDPWKWPEIEWLSSDGHEHITARQLSGPLSKSWVFDVPKANGTHRTAVMLDPVERVLYQACTDNFAPTINAHLPDWVYGWRLPVGRNSVSRYARQDYQWQNYVHSLYRSALRTKKALKIDIKDYFKSVSEPLLIDSIASLSAGFPGKTAIDIAIANGRLGGGGLPQRSTASSVISNLVISSIGRDLAARPGGNLNVVRWVDDTWVFTDKTSALEDVQAELIGSLRDLGFEPNPDKTEILEGDDLETQILQMGGNLDGYGLGSSVDHLHLRALALDGNEPAADPLHAAVINIIEGKNASHREMKHLVGQVKRQERLDLAIIMVRNPDAFMGHARLAATVFKRFELWSKVSGWYKELLDSDAPALAKIDFLSMYPDEAVLPDDIAKGLAEMMLNCSQPELVESVLVSRLAQWAPQFVRAHFVNCIERNINPLLRRAIGMAAAYVGVEKRRVRSFLFRDEATYPTACYLDATGFRVKVTNDE